ncbi:hypothetical protein SLS62_005112 [Diatrype stigma]|uniref:FAD-binding PCMH-type domain-containing protein n=1 Tax=Diatrype stigma TaxID=117547 RepID=A0AAN9US88_9PEZI
MPVRGANSVDDGILMVMSNLTNIAIAPDRSSINVSPGLTWSDVYAYLIDFDRTAVGGRISPIGVSGLALGGGISLHGNQYGWAADNVLEYEVVLANGEVAIANETTHNDLFWALKGGGPNFGIVTNFKLRAIPSTKVLAGIYTINGTEMEPLMSAVANYTAHNTDAFSHILPLVEVVDKSTTIGLVLFYDSPTQAGPACLDEFFAIPSIKSTVEFKTIGDFVVERNTFSIPDINDVLFAGTIVGRDYDDVHTGLKIIHDTFYEKLSELDSAVPAEALEYIGIAWQPLPEIWMNASQRINPSGNPLGLDPSKGLYIAWAGIVMWNDSRYDTAVADWAAEVTGVIDRTTKAKGLYDPFKYMNDAAGFQDVYGGYGAKSRGKLLEISRKYDPWRVFQTSMPGGFKIGV